MTDQQPIPVDGDTEGHMPRIRFADAERDETDDTEGHAGKFRFADAERDETDDDVAGHLSGALGAKKRED